MSFNLSELFERVVDAAADREAIVSPSRRLTYRQLDARANRLAHALARRGVGPGDHVGLQLMNGTEYVEGMLACFKLRAVPINVNYRYVERELAYLYNNADLVALVVEESLVPAVTPVLPASRIASVLVVGSGEGKSPPGITYYEAALAEADDARDFGERSSDDRYIAYTGGTTGMPKGVVWRHDDIFFAALGGGDPTLDKGPITSPDQLVERLPPYPLVQLCCPPLMHVSAHWGAFIVWFSGGKVVLLSPGSFRAEEAWLAVESEKVNVITVVGDAMARPLLDALERGSRLDTSSLLVFSSGGATLSASTKRQIRALLGDVIIIDALGSSETGLAASRSSTGDDHLGARFSVDERTKVLDEDLCPVQPGSGVVGRLARRGHVPLGYYKDEAKTASTFVEVHGQRWVLPGDLATVEADGTITLRGRASGTINTGGEKVFAEEVEAVLRGHPDVFDALVVGSSDERFGQRVVAVVAPREGSCVTLEAIQAYARSELAGYKVPRQLVLVEAISRTESGKPDYAWARRMAEASS